jgi:acyl-coenzyme A thioesterase PaaI-like protein
MQKESTTSLVGFNQGGFLAAMLYDTMAPALTTALNDNQFDPTLALKTTFIAPAKVGEIYEHGPVVFKGCSVCVVEGELTQDGKLVARSTATALIRRISKWF